MKLIEELRKTKDELTVAINQYTTEIDYRIKEFNLSPDFSYVNPFVPELPIDTDKTPKPNTSELENTPKPSTIQLPTESPKPSTSQLATESPKPSTSQLPPVDTSSSSNPQSDIPPSPFPKPTDDTTWPFGVTIPKPISRYPSAFGESTKAFGESSGKSPELGKVPGDFEDPFSGGFTV